MQLALGGFVLAQAVGIDDAAIEMNFLGLRDAAIERLLVGRERRVEAPSRRCSRARLYQVSGRSGQLASTRR